ncbi:cyclic nucleotide-binding domain-containing protein [Clostridium butyricum]|uniref:cyclic nucleotide-binding domain-containing protein n=1 Tax=Clostridium butyricum TaxID=1492 RepID=UPI0024BA6EE3|nr:cyclic nucleotide-binding domain-containing protein [Clostridium butyricum]
MEILDDKELLDKYVEKYNIDKIFSFWDKYEAKLVKYSKNEIICSKDRSISQITFIVKGYVKIYYVSAEGKVLYLALKKDFTMLGEVEFAGEIDIPYAESVSEVIAVSISTDKYKDLLNEDVVFCRYVIKCLASKISLSAKTSFINQLHSKESRLAIYILTNEKNNVIDEKWTETSNLLAFSYRQLMRLLNNFCEDGLIKRSNKKGRYEIVNREKLQNLCADLQI